MWKSFKIVRDVTNQKVKSMSDFAKKRVSSDVYQHPAASRQPAIRTIIPHCLRYYHQSHLTKAFDEFLTAEHCHCVTDPYYLHLRSRLLQCLIIGHI